MPELRTRQLASSTTSASLATQATGLVPAPNRRRLGPERRGRQPVDDARPQGRPRSPAASSAPRCGPPPRPRTAGASARSFAAGRRHLWRPRAGLDARTRGRDHSPGVWYRRPSRPWRPLAQRGALESAKAGTTGAAARRSGPCALAPADLACPQKGAEAGQQTRRCIDASGFAPLPSVVRTDAPVGQTPILREWWTRDHRSAIAAISPAGTRYFHSQDRALDAADVRACLAYLRREVPGWISIIGDGAPIQRRQVIQACLAQGAAQRIHGERLPA
jgi:hypothetical protein